MVTRRDNMNTRFGFNINRVLTELSMSQKVGIILIILYNICWYEGRCAGGGVCREAEAEIV